MKADNKKLNITNFYYKALDQYPWPECSVFLITSADHECSDWWERKEMEGLREKKKKCVREAIWECEARLALLLFKGCCCSSEVSPALSLYCSRGDTFCATLSHQCLRSPCSSHAQLTEHEVTLGRAASPHKIKQSQIGSQKPLNAELTWGLVWLQCCSSSAQPRKLLEKQRGASSLAALRGDNQNTQHSALCNHTV